MLSKYFFIIFPHSSYILKKTDLKMKSKMTSVREKVIELIRSLPEDSTVDEILEELYIRIQVDHELKELDEQKGNIT